MKQDCLAAQIKRKNTRSNRIFSLYADHPVQPEIQVTANTFKIILPNMNDPKFIYDANILMSANAVIARARRDGHSPEQIAKMNTEQLRAYLHSEYTRNSTN